MHFLLQNKKATKINLHHLQTCDQRTPSLKNRFRRLEPPQGLIFGAQDLFFGAQDVVFGAWDLIFGTQNRPGTLAAQSVHFGDDSER